MRVENATPRPAAKLARAGNEDDMGSAQDDRRGALRIGVLITELLVEGVARAGIWADLYCVRGENGVAIKRTQGEAR